MGLTPHFSRGRTPNGVRPLPTPPSTGVRPRTGSDPFTASSDGQTLGLSLCFFRKRQLQNTIVEPGGGGGLVHVLAELEAAGHSAEVALGAQDAFAILFLPFLLALGADGNAGTVDLHMDVFLLDTGQLGLDLVAFGILFDIHSHFRRFERRIKTEVDGPDEETTEEIAEGVAAGDVAHVDSPEIIITRLALGRSMAPTCLACICGLAFYFQEREGSDPAWGLTPLKKSWIIHGDGFIIETRGFIRACQ